MMKRSNSVVTDNFKLKPMSKLEMAIALNEKEKVIAVSEKKRAELKRLKQIRVATDVETQEVKRFIRRKPEYLEKTKPEIERILQEYVSDLPLQTKINQTPMINNRTGLMQNDSPSFSAMQKVDIIPDMNLSRSTSTDSCAPTTVRKFLPGNRQSARLGNVLDIAAMGYTRDHIGTSAKLVDYVLMVGPNMAELESAFDENESVQDPKDLHVILHPWLLYADKSHISKDIDIKSLPYFCFPSGINVTGEHYESADTSSHVSTVRFTRFEPGMGIPERHNKSQTFVFRLSDHNSFHYGVCLIVPRCFVDNDRGMLITANYCICLVTEYPYFNFLFNLLQQFDAAGGLDFSSPVEEQVTGLLLRDDLEHLKNLINRLQRTNVPAVRGFVRVELNINNKQLVVKMQRLFGPGSGRDKIDEKNDEICYYTMLWALPTLLKCFPLEELLLLIGCVLTEMSIIVVSPNMSQVSACILALLNLMRPLKWALTVVISVPEAYITDFIDNPTPFIVGTQRLPADFVQMERIVVLDIPRGKVKLFEKDLITGNTLVMPQSNRLSRSLKVQYETIKSVMKTSFPRLTAGWEVYPEGIVMPVLALDLDSEQGRRLRSGVKNFYDAVNKHIVLLLNTCISRDREIKLQASTKKKSRPQSMRLRAGSAASEMSTTSKEGEDVVLTGGQFNTMEVGTLGAEYIKRILVTMMYDQYCDRVLNMGAQKLDSNACVTPRGPSTRSEHLFPIHEGDDNSHDPWVTLFTLALGGALPLSKEAIRTLSDAYTATCLPLNTPSSEQLLELGNTAFSDGVSIHGYLCNGHCEGKANTAECTLLCVQLWTERVQALRRQIHLKDIIIKNYPCDFILNDIVLADGKRVCVKPRLAPVQHKRETKSQFEKRKKDAELACRKGEVDYLRRHDENLKQHAKAVVGWHKKKLTISVLNQRRRERQAAQEEKRNRFAIIIQCYFRRFAVRNRIIDIVRAQLVFQSTRRLKKFIEIVAKYELLTLRNLQSKLTIRPGSPKYSSASNLYSKSTDDKAFTAKPFSPDKFNLLTKKALEEHPVVVSRPRDLETMSVGSTGSRLGGRFREAISSISEYLKPSRKDSCNSSQVDEEELDAVRKPSWTDMMGSPKWGKGFLKIKGASPLQTVQESYSPSTGKRGSLPPLTDKFINLTPPRASSYDTYGGGGISTRSSMHLDQMPLKVMNPAVFRILIPDQRDMIVDLWTILRKGILIQKLSKSGSHQRYLYCDVDMIRLFWRSTEKDRPSEATLADDSDGERERERERDQRSSSHRRSSITSGFNRRRSSFFGKTDSQRELLFEDIIDVHDTIVTEVARISHDRGHLSGDRGLVSLEAGDRSLDFEVSDEEVYRLVNNGLQVYVDFLKKVKNSDGLHLSESICGTPKGTTTFAFPFAMDNMKSSSASSGRLSARPSLESKDISVANPSCDKEDSLCGSPGAVLCVSPGGSSSESRGLNARLYSHFAEIHLNMADPANAPMPICVMPRSVFRVLIPGQRQIVVELWNLLRKGVPIMKHCMNGKPKLKYLYCDVDMKRLFWRSRPEVKPSPSGNEGDTTNNYDAERLAERRMSELNATKRRSSFGLVRTDADREIYFEDISETYDTIATDVMKRSQLKNYINMSEAHSFMISIVAPDRTLDFEMDEFNFGTLNHGLKIMAVFYQNIPRNSRIENWVII